MRKIFWFLGLLFVVELSTVTWIACGNNELKVVGVSSIDLSRTSLSLEVGEKRTLTATVLPDNAMDANVTWASDNANVASVENGVVTAKSVGTAKISATAGGKTTTCTVTVAEKIIAVTDVILSKTELELTVGDTETLNVSILPEDATDKTVTWASSKKAVATVDDNGKITAVSEGTANIVATVGYKKVTCVVTVKTALPSEPTVWKILWLICPTVDTEINGTHYHTQMTDEQIEILKQYAARYEEFVENAAAGYLDLDITIDVLQNPITNFDGDNNSTYGGQIPLADRFRLKPEENYDGLILSIDYTNIPNVRWLGITAGRTSWIMFCSNGCSMSYGGLDPSPDTKRFLTNVYVHEWCHQIEGYFPTIHSSFSMPILHNDTNEYAYTDQNTGLWGEERLSKWYYDYIHGSIVSYPGATGTCKGVQPTWWQYPPLMWKSKVRTSPKNYDVNVSNPPKLTVEWDKPIKSTWNYPDFHIVLRDGITNEELGFYRVTNQMSNDKMKLTVDFSKPLYRMWDWTDETVEFEPEHPYRIHTYSFDYESRGTGVNGESASFDILFTTAP